MPPTAHASNGEQTRPPPRRATRGPKTAPRPPMRRNMKAVMIYLAPKLYTALKESSVATGCSMSTLVRMLLVEKLTRPLDAKTR